MMNTNEEKDKLRKKYDTDMIDILLIVLSSTI